MILSENHKLNWYGHFNTITGYGVVNLEYPQAITRQGWDVTCGWERYDEGFVEWQYLTPEEKAFIKKPFVKAPIGIIKSLPTEFVFNQSDFRIGYTMVENTIMNKHWVDCCNQMNMIFVPSEFLVRIFKDSGVTVPVKSVRQGIATNKFPFFDRSEQQREKFVFGTVGFMDDRKNWKDLITAFISEFDPIEPVELWIKNTNNQWGYVSNDDERIKIIKTRYGTDEMNKLYQLMDCFVFPSHAEGSGLPPREAMATGLPVILTNWSGLTEIANPEWSYLLTPIAIDHPDYRKEEQPGFQARIEVRELMYWMRYVYEKKTEGLEKGKLASDFIHLEYSWDKCTILLLDHLKDL